MKRMCKKQQQGRQQNAIYRVLTNAQLPNTALLSIYRKPLKSAVSATAIAAAASPFTAISYPETGSKTHIVNIAREPCLKLLTVVGLTNAPMPLFELICPTFSWCRTSSHHNEWSYQLGMSVTSLNAWGFPAALQRVVNVSLSNSSEHQLCSTMTAVIWVLVWVFHTKANILVYLQDLARALCWYVTRRQYSIWALYVVIL